MSWLKDLFGRKSAPPSKKRSGAQTSTSPSNRAEILKEAMAIQQKGRAQIQAVLEKALAEGTAKPPRPSDLAGMTRLLELRRAVLAMRGVADHEGQRDRVRGLKGARTKPRD
jgi:hypothetical protein